MDEPKINTKSGESAAASPLRVRNVLQGFRTFLNWCHESELWTKPRRFETIFKAKPSLSLDERRQSLQG